jgi:hypothetical protein
MPSELKIELENIDDKNIAISLLFYQNGNLGLM